MNRWISVCLGAVLAMAVVVPAVAERGHRHDYRGHQGYREHPYDEHRRYGHYEHRGQRYAYQGHWRSWDEWNDYYRHRPWMHEHGHYYWEGVHLMFRFCDPAGGGCFFFSIGR